MTLASSRTTATNLQIPQGQQTVPVNKLVLPDLLRCVVVSWSELRGQLLQTAASEEEWQAEVCANVNHFIRRVFQTQVPLTIVDLPKSGVANYSELRTAAEKTCGVGDSLLMVCGSGDNQDTVEELWARQLGFGLICRWLPIWRD